MTLDFAFLLKYNKASISKLVTIKHTSSSSVPILRLPSDSPESFVQITPENETNSNARLLDLQGLPKKTSYISCKNFTHVSNSIALAH